LSTNIKIIILNGAGSAGKGSIAKALQAVTNEPFLHVQMDTFIAMLPEAYSNHPDGFSYQTVDDDDGNPVVVIKAGPIGERALRGMRHAIAAMADQGNNLIVDDVMLEGEAAEYIKLLAKFDVFFVGVFAPLNVLETRERQRADRMIGLARWQYDRVHRNMKYDLEVDTSCATSMECANLIKETFRL